MAKWKNEWNENEDRYWNPFILYEHNAIEDASWWHEKCKKCGTTDANYLYCGYCEDCLAKLYDRYEPLLFRFFAEYDPEEYLEDDCPAPLKVLWAEADIQRKRNEMGESRKFLRDYALEDPNCFASWLEKEGFI